LLAGPGACTWETARPRFVGRGHAFVTPRAVLAEAPLASAAGSVLDPVLALRRTVTIAPGETARWLLALASDDARGPLLAALARIAAPGAADAAFAGAAERERALGARL